MARLQNKKQAAVTTGSAKSSGIPCAMVLRLIRDLPGEPGFLAPIIARLVTTRLGASVGAPGPHDFAVRFGAVRPRKNPHASPTRPPQPASRLVTIAIRPSRMRRDGDRQSYFSEKWEYNILPQPPGRANRLASCCERSFFRAGDFFHCEASRVAPSPHRMGRRLPVGRITGARRPAPLLFPRRAQWPLGNNWHRRCASGWIRRERGVYSQACACRPSSPGRGILRRA
jgi:hypothetical protein